MKSEMARAGLWLDLHRWRLVFLQSALIGIEAVDKHLIESQIGDKGEVIGGIEVDGMCMRFLLTGWIDALAAMLTKRGTFTESAILFDVQHRGTAAAVVGN